MEENHIEKMRLLDTSDIARVYPNLTYASFHTNEKIDILLPEQGEEPFPVILWLHGGGCVKGHRLQATVDGDFLGGVFKARSQGYAIAAVGYTFVQQMPWPRAALDVKAAIRFLRSNADKYHLDPNRMVLWGESAGAQLAELTAATFDKGVFDEEPQSDSSVCGMVSLFGLSDLSCFREQFEQINVTPLCSPCDLPIQFMLGYPPEQQPENARKNSAIAYVTSSFPETLLQHGTADPLVPYLQSVTLTDKVKKICGEDRITLELLQGEGHATAGFHTDENTNHILDFLDRICQMDRVKYPRTQLPEIPLTEEEYPL